MLFKLNKISKYNMYSFCCVIFVLFLIFFIFLYFKKNSTENYENRETNKVVFIIPSTSRNMNYANVESCSLLKILYSSLQKLDLSKRYTFLIGTDDDDDFYNKNTEAIKAKLPENFHFHKLNNFDKSYVCIVNQLADIAMQKYNAQYVYVFADDLEVYELDFIERDFIPYFKANGDSCLGWGVDKTNMALCTHPFVNKKHIEKLGYFYPPAIKNWFCDDWIHRLYEKLNKIIKSKNAVIKNVLDADNVKRYEISKINEDTISTLVSSALEKLT